MWDKPQALSMMANLIFLLTASMVVYAAINRVTHLPFFTLQTVKVEGKLDHETREQIEYIVKKKMKGNFFTVDLKRVQSDFEKLPWVRSVSVKRKWPLSLEISIEEHVALARWGAGVLINTFGEEFVANTDQALPGFTGPEGSSFEVAGEYNRFSRTLLPIRQSLVQVNLSDRRAWQIRLESGMVIELGRDRVERRLARFVSLYDKTIGSLNKDVKYVDLRYDNGFAVRVNGPEKGKAA